MKAITQSQLLSPLLASLALAAATSGMPAQAASCSIGNSPEGIVIDASGFLWVANTDLNTLSFFSPHQSGQSLLFGGLGDSPLNATNGLNGPTRIAVSGNEVYVTNAAGDTVTIWNDSANKQQTVPGVKRPLGIAVDGGGNYVVADNQTSDIAAFTSANLLLGVQTQDGNGHPFDAPGALAISGSILYVGTNDGTVHSYNESNFIEFYELARLGIRIPGLMTELTTFQDSASGGPTGIAVDAQGNVYVSYYYSSDVVKYNSAGVKLLTITAGISYPEGIAIEPSSGFVYVANTGSHDITIYNSGGAYLGIFTYSCL